MKTLALALLTALLFVGQTFATAPTTGVDDAMSLLTKELKLTPTQKPAVQSALSSIASKAASLPKNNLAGNALGGGASNQLFDQLKTSLGKVLNADQLSKLGGLKEKLMGMLGL